MKHLHRFYLSTSAKSFHDFNCQVKTKASNINNPYLLNVVAYFNTITKSMSFCDNIKLNYITKDEVMVSLKFTHEIIDGVKIYTLIIVTSDDYNYIH